MSDVNNLLRQEAEHAETHKDAPEQPGTKASRPGGGRARVFSIRLTEAEFDALDAAAVQQGMPASTLARAWITERLAADGHIDDVQAIADALANFSRRLSTL